MDTLDLAKEYGPAILSVVGTVLVTVFSGIWGTLAFIWKLQKKRLTKLEEHSSSLCAAIRGTKEAFGEEHSKIRESLITYREEVKGIAKIVEPFKRELSHLEEVIRHQSESIHLYAERMGAVGGKIDALFKLMDAKGVRNV